MLVLLGGRERSGQDYASMLERTGYRLEHTITTDGLFSVLEAVHEE
jgi:hypothetical protein